MGELFGKFKAAADTASEALQNGRLSSKLFFYMLS